MGQEEEAKKALKAIKLASETVRSAMAAALPVANTQVLTIAVPGTMINYKDFVYNADDTIKAPLAVRVNEARLVDGMIPLSKFTSGKTGKSVARSYLSTLDLLVPVEASVSGVIGNDSTAVVDGRLKVVKDRYVKAMDYLKSTDDTPGGNGRSKLATYVDKQDRWSQAVQAYANAQNQALQAVKPPSNATTTQVKAAREEYMQWIQEHGRDYKQAIQARYMDWVVHGYKFMIDFNFGIVDISSGMKRIENSKEAFRNLILIADDGVSEYSSVILTPSDWATIVKQKVENWDAKNKEPTPAEIRAEIRRLKNLLASHETLKDGVDSDSFFPVMASDGGAGDNALKKAYAEVYSSLDEKNQADLSGPVVPADKKKSWIDKYPAEGAAADGEGATASGEGAALTDPKAKSDAAFGNLVKAQQAWNEASLKRNNTTVRKVEAKAKEAASAWLFTKIAQIKSDIESMEKRLPGGSAPGSVAIMTPQVYDENGVVIRPEDAAAGAAFLGKAVPEPSKWTRVSCKASSSTSVKESESQESSSAIAAKAGWGFWSVSGGASHTQSSAKAMSSMSNLDVEIQMDCMVVEIDRPWLHAELFSDAELDSGNFDISPGEAELKRMYENDVVPSAYYQQFSSFPTAFIVAADVELSFSGDTASLESAISASSTSANVSVGYGPFSVSASHSQSQSKSKTKMESTATGCKISIQAPQIVGWVQALMPQLPRAKDGKSRMVGLFN